MQGANFEEGKKEQGVGRGITRTITRLETLVLKPGYSRKCFFSLFYAFDIEGNPELNLLDFIRGGHRRK